MRDVFIAGTGQTDIGEHWDRSLKDLAVEAVCAALPAERRGEVDCLLVGNMLSGELASQENLGACAADWAGLGPVEAVKIESACASGGAAFREGYLRVASGASDCALVLGVEKMTDLLPDGVSAGLALAADGDTENLHGATFVALNALIMRRYMHENGCRHEDFSGFAVNAHRNAAANARAMFRREVTGEDYARACMVASPINLLDSSAICDGAGAVLLCADPQALGNARRIRVTGSGAACDTIAVASRQDPLQLLAAELSSRRALAGAGRKAEDIDLFELHDAFSIMAVLSLEACGFAPRGRGLRLALEGEIGPRGRVPIATRGGLKARGHPVGATGVLQVIDAVAQLRGEAGASQVPEARVAMTQNIGGSGASIYTHILEAEG
ncbi:MAG: acetyl-CoA acetyltransferase [Elusimicrobia bacterium GWA2_69_24]|nr:MAG: acetyl-CoA acetyltransferase [Elusimicrobia bacterium GWA2_69_24]